MIGTATDPEKIRRELAKSFASQHVSEIIAHVYRLPGAPKKTGTPAGCSLRSKIWRAVFLARQSSTDSDMIRCELAKSFTTERVREIMAHVYCLPRAPKTTARDGGFYEAMIHGVRNHVVWDASDLESLLQAVPAGSIGIQAVDLVRAPIPSCFRENKVLITHFSPLG